MIAAYLGYKAPKTAEQQQREGAMGPDDFAAFVKMAGQGLPK